MANPANVLLEDYHGKKQIYGPKVGEGKEVARGIAEHTAMTNTAVLEEPVAANDLARKNLEADLLEERTIRRVSTDPKDLAEVKDFEAVSEQLKELRIKQTTGTATEKKVAEAAMREMAKSEAAREHPRPSIQKRLYRYGISKE